MISIEQSANGTGELNRGRGTLAYDVQGVGPLVVCVPGMGDLRSTYRFLVPQLVAAGYRVATLDLRGHGESSTEFDSYDDAALASDVVALTQKLGGPAILVGNSMGAGAAVIAAAEHPELVARLVLIGPFVRNSSPFPGASQVMRLALLQPWGPRVWKSFHRRMFTGAPPSDYDEFQRTLMASLTRPGAWRALQQTTRTSHQQAEDSLRNVKAPTLVVMGGNDPDFKSPADEAAFVASELNGEVVLVPDAGHYPQAESPEVVGKSIITFLHETARG